MVSEVVRLSHDCSTKFGAFNATVKSDRSLATTMGVQETLGARTQGSSQDEMYLSKIMCKPPALFRKSKRCGGNEKERG